MPSSSDDVATRHGICPAFRSSSTTIALLARERAVVRPRDLLLGQLVQPQREPLREPAVVDEDDRGAVLTDELEDGGIDRRPDRAAGLFHSAAHLHAVCQRGHGQIGGRTELAHVLDRNDHLEVELLARARVDELDLPLRARDEAADLGERALRRREADALEWSLDQRLQSLERQRQVRATLRPGDRVHLVEDHRLDATQRLARLRGEKQEERFGSRDQDVRRRLLHPPPLVGRSVTGANADRELGAEAGERASQVALDVVVQRLQRRDVQEPEPLAGRRVQPVDPDQEGRERLPRARRRLDEDVPAPGDRRPPELLRRGGAGERALEPLPRRGREGVERGHFPRVPRRSTLESVPEALYFTDSDEANALIATEPLALLIGFALDQQITVQTAFLGPLKLQQRIGPLDARAIASMDPQELEQVFRQRPGIHRFPAAMARRVQDLCAFVAEEYDGNAERVWTEATDAADLRRRIGALPGFGKMKVTALGSVLALRFGVEVASELVPGFPTLGNVDSREALAEYQAEKRAHRATQRQLTQNNPA